MKLLNQIYQAFRRSQQMTEDARNIAKENDGFRHVAGLLVAGESLASVKVFINSIGSIDPNNEVGLAFRKGCMGAVRKWEERKSLPTYAIQSPQSIDNTNAIRELYLPIIYELVGRMGGKVDISRRYMASAQGNRISIENEVDIVTVRIK